MSRLRKDITNYFTAYNTIYHKNLIHKTYYLTDNLDALRKNVPQTF